MPGGQQCPLKPESQGREPMPFSPPITPGDPREFPPPGQHPGSDSTHLVSLMGRGEEGCPGLYPQPAPCALTPAGCRLALPISANPSCCLRLTSSAHLPGSSLPAEPRHPTPLVSVRLSRLMEKLNRSEAGEKHLYSLITPDTVHMHTRIHIHMQAHTCTRAHAQPLEPVLPKLMNSLAHLRCCWLHPRCSGKGVQAGLRW